MIRTYSTYAGARREAKRTSGSIIRILCDPHDLFVVAPSIMRTQIMSVSDAGCDGAISLADLTTRGAA